MATQEPMTGTATFLLSKLGQLANSRFGERLTEIGLRPRHCGVLEMLTDGPVSQLTVARGLGVAPSVVVDMTDELERLDAVRRVRDDADRRRQLIELTETGRRLRRQAMRAAAEVDAELLAPLRAADATKLRAVLGRLGETHLGLSQPS
jgi:DNA-binding MarR family transcriptional regulator